MQQEREMTPERRAQFDKTALAVKKVLSQKKALLRQQRNLALAGEASAEAEKALAAAAARGAGPEELAQLKQRAAEAGEELALQLQRLPLYGENYQNALRLAGFEDEAQYEAALAPVGDADPDDWVEREYRAVLQYDRSMGITSKKLWDEEESL